MSSSIPDRWEAPDAEAKRNEARIEAQKLRQLIREAEQRKGEVELNIERRRAGGSKSTCQTVFRLIF